MAPNKIAIITGKDPMFAADTDGANILVKNLADHYAGEGTKVDIFTPNGYSGHQAVKRKADYQSQAKDLLEENVNVNRFPIPKLITPNLSYAGLNFMNRVAISMAEATYFEDRKLDEYSRIHILHMAHAFGLVLGEIVPIDKTVLHPMLLGREYERYTQVAPSYIDFELEVFKRKLLVQVPSLDESLTLQKDYGVDENQIISNPRGFNQECLTPLFRKTPNKTDTLSILCANMMRPQKGQHLFIPFAKECLRRGISIKINLIGVNGSSYSPSYNQYALDIREAIIKEGLKDCFEFSNPLDQANLNKVMHKSDFAIYPSVFETFGKAPLESMATGLPTIVLDDVPAFQEFLQDNETGLFVSRHSSALVDALERCLNEKGLYEKLSRQGIEAGKNFHWKVVLEQMINDINKWLSHALPA
jgi:glycosyltransferase involved in cell wall biosynthesis